MLNPSERVRLMKEMRKLPEGEPLAKWEAVSQWLSWFEDSDRSCNCDDEWRSLPQRNKWIYLGVCVAIKLGGI